MITWQSDFSETAGTPVQDCGTPAGFWANGSPSSYWWETDGSGYLTGGTGAVMYNYIYHVASNADQSVKLTFERMSNASKIPQILFRTAKTTPSSDLTYVTPGLAVKYSSGAWRITHNGTLLAQVADAGYADGTDDPDGDEVRVLEASFVGTTATIAVHKGGGTLLGPATAEVTTIPDAGNIGILLNGAYSDSGDLTLFVRFDAAEVVDGVGAGSNAATVSLDVADIIMGIQADANAANAVTASLAVEDVGMSVTASLVEQGLVIHTLLVFENAYDLGRDSSGNGNDWTLTGAGQSGDTPTNNFAVLNPVQGDPYTYPRGTLSKGNLSWTATSVTSNWNVFSWMAARFPVYFEISSSGILYGGFGVMGEQSHTTGAYLVGGFPGSWGFRVEPSAFDKYVEGGRFAGWYAITVENKDTIGIAVDPVNGKMWVSKNGVWLVGDPETGASPAVEFTPQGVLPGVSAWTSKDIAVNFGATGFISVPPTGFSALCTGNLPDDAYDTAGSYVGNGNADGPCVFTGCALESVTIDGTTYVNNGTPGGVVMFTSCGFKLVSTTRNANGTTYNWTGALLYPTKYSNAQ